MKRIFIVGFLMLVSTACGSTTPGIPSAGSGDDWNTGPPATDRPTTDVSYTVSGTVVSRDTGAAYPNAYVRFGWLVSAGYEMEAHTVTDSGGRYSIQLAAGRYQVTAGDSCDLNAGFTIAGPRPDDVMIDVPGTSVVDFVEYPITPGADLPGVC
jgi:Carboxypeptidase regulatory-like domain